MEQHPRKVRSLGSKRRETQGTITNANLEPGIPEKPFLSVKEVAEYLQINTKKVYNLVGDGKIPATKVTGKWLFPRKLVDHWLMESSHGGLLTDRLVMTGSDDSLIRHATTLLVNKLQGHALVSYSHTNTELGLSLLARNRADVAGVRWGPSEESERRHAALIQNYPPYRSWVLVRVLEREHGLIIAPEFGAPVNTTELFKRDVRWTMRHRELGSQSHLSAFLKQQGVDVTQLHLAHRVLSQHEAASLLCRGEADVTPGTRGCATQYDLDFISLGWEAYDLALNRGIYFRTLFQKLMEEIQSPECLKMAKTLGGYEFRQCGRIIWSD